MPNLLIAHVVKVTRKLRDSPSEIWSACTREVKTATADVSIRELLLRVTSSCVRDKGLIFETGSLHGVGIGAIKV